MTCYQRHLGSLFESLCFEYDKANRARVDAAIRQVLGVAEGAHCPEVWAAIKALSPAERDDLPARVADALRGVRRAGVSSRRPQCLRQPRNRNRSSSSARR
jgi:hypothetical protein